MDENRFNMNSKKLIAILITSLYASKFLVSFESVNR